MKKGNNKMSTGRKTKAEKKVKKKPEPEKEPLEPVIETKRPVLGVNDVYAAKKVQEKPKAEIVAAVRFEHILKCSCGGVRSDVKILYVCPKCERTWCDFCRKSQTACPICDIQGIRVK